MNHASIFSGIGGPEVAASMLGWNNVFHCEVNKFCKKILDFWYPNSVSYGNIYEVDFRQWQGKIEVLSGGFPCQPFSHAGQRKGTKDNRYLWPQMVRVISEIRPSWVVAENVAGIISMVEPNSSVKVETQTSLFGEDNNIHRYQYRASFTYEQICRDFEELGYEVQPFIIPACAAGAPHRRDRIFFIAFNKDSHIFRRQRNEELGQCSEHGNAWSTSHDGKTKSSYSNPTDARSERVRQRSYRLRKSRFTADTDSPDGGTPRLRNNPQRSENLQEQKESIHDGSCRFGSEGTTPNTNSIRGRKCDNVGKEKGSPICEGEFICSYGLNYTPGQRWESFPTVSPIHRGSNGFPLPVDILAIPFRRWRKQSLRAYGNAIVPQVMYEIFRAIEIVTNQISDQDEM